MLCIAPMTVATKPGRRGEREENRKTIAQGVPACCGVPVVYLLVCFFILHARLRVQTGIRHSLRPLLSRDEFQQNPDAFAPRERALVPRTQRGTCDALLSRGLCGGAWVPALRRTAKEALRRVRDTRTQGWRQRVSLARIRAPVVADQSLLAGVWMNPLFHVGLIRISFMQTRDGMPATKAMVRPRSSGCSILACSCSDGATGRSLRIGVATSPGERQQARRPLTHSSMLKEWVSASTACFVVV